MARLDIPAAPAQYTTQYANLKGVDFSVSPVEVDRQHSPDMLNMISDEGGNPVKRKGWRRIHQFTHYDYMTEQTVNDAVIYDIHNCKETLYVATEACVYKSTDGENWEEAVNRDWENGLGERYRCLFVFSNIRLFSYNGEVWAAGSGRISAAIPGNWGDISNSFFKTGIFYCPVEDIANDMLMSAGLDAVAVGAFGDPDPRHTIPEIVTSRHPDGTGGTMLDSAAVNMATPFRIASFLGDGTSTQYNLYPTSDWTNDLYKYVVIARVEVRNSNGDFESVPGWVRGTSHSVSAYDRNGQETNFHVTDPYITFTEAHAPIVGGQDNVRITYMPVNATLGRVESDGDGNPGEFIEDSSSTVAKGIYNYHLAAICTKGIARNYGYSNNDRLFLLADDNRVYFTAASDASNIPDSNYIAVSNTQAIVGLHRYDDRLVAITGNTTEEASVYFINGTELSDGTHSFAVKASSVTVGAIAKNSFVPLIDEPLFVSRTGVYCINNHYASTRLAVRNRSMFINKALTNEANIKDAVAEEWNNYYILAIPGSPWRCYVLDGRQATKDRKNNTDYSYECYVFENVPATCFGKLNGELYFALDTNWGAGGLTATLCKFNTDVDDRTAYEDDGDMDENGSLSGGMAINAYWSSKADHDISYTQFKTLSKRGNVLVLKPDIKTSVDVSYSKDGERQTWVGYFSGSTHTWEMIDFADLTFRAHSDTQDIYMKKKVKKYKTLRVYLYNSEIDEPFGIVSVVRTYTVGNFAK